MKNSNKDLSTLNTKQLCKLAKRFGIKNASKTKKASLVALLETARAEREAKKNAPKPPKARQVYKRKNILHVCFKGKLFAPLGESTFKQGDKVTVEFSEVGAFVRSASAPLEGEEIWTPIEIPSTPRVKKAPKPKATKKPRAKKAQQVEPTLPEGTNVLDLEDAASTSEQPLEQAV